MWNIFSIFKRKPKEPDTDSFSTWFNYQIEFEKERSINMQNIEDANITRSIKREARRMFNEWLDATVMIIDGKEYHNYLPIISPLVSFYTIYDEETARYKDQDIRKIVMEEYARLKREESDIKID